ncbi:Malectin-like carbohydrate-binding domain containing protein [Parasponia andersonii]|uniref:Malectin-like carbohydrate-binding domain containing protein n=1 Tax=Parasponia andersonii TaxID=3476 RepID=A0A2P5DK60_PARAD|nr:Malectin-like carbohydrate-binding domain containing protein [Parasponia andersonii]
MTPNLAMGNDTWYDTSKTPDNVFGTAVKSSSGPINFSWVSMNETTSFYAFFYIKAIEPLLDGEKRTLLIHLDDQILTHLAVLEYLKPVVLTNPQTQPIKGKINHSFSISSTSNNDVPPILSAFEIYHSKFFDLPVTDPLDVDAIVEIKQIYKITENW